jgi:hypothetical protein
MLFVKLSVQIRKYSGIDTHSGFATMTLLNVDKLPFRVIIYRFSPGVLIITPGCRKQISL